MQSIPHNLSDSSRYCLSDKIACGMWLLKVLFTSLLSACISSGGGGVCESGSSDFFRENIDLISKLVFILHSRILIVIF